MINERIKELGSAILNVKGGKIHITGFMSKERLSDYLYKNKDCRFSEGLYDIKPYDVAYLEDNALLIVLEDDIEVCRYEFTPILSTVIRYRDINNTPRSKTISVRRCKYSGVYNIKDIECSLLFNNKTELLFYLFKEFGVQIEL